jgi:hypothetical protein
VWRPGRSERENVTDFFADPEDLPSGYLNIAMENDPFIVD